MLSLCHDEKPGASLDGHWPAGRIVKRATTVSAGFWLDGHGYHDALEWQRFIRAPVHKITGFTIEDCKQWIRMWVVW